MTEAPAERQAPRRSELRRSEDYSGPSLFSGVFVRSRAMAHHFGTVLHVQDELLADLDPEQLAAVTAQHSPLAIIAPAGSGKTRVLTRRIAYRVREGLAEPRHVLALTFTRKAAGELQSRLGALGVDRSVTAGTFHAIALAQLRRHATEHGREPPRVLDRKARLLGPLVGGSPVAVQEVAAEIEWAKARLVPPEEYARAASAAGRRPSRPFGAIAELYERYESEKYRRRVLDFDDVLARCASAIERTAAFAEAQRWRFRHLFVDEFQDTTPLQLRLLEEWYAPGNDLTVVGDPAQAIDGFAGADASPLNDFDRTFAHGETIALARNYRSTPEIVALAESALGRAGGTRRTRPVAVRAAGARPTSTAYADDEAEAAGVAERCWRAFTAGTPWHHMAVLFRTNAQSSMFEAALHRRGVPFRVADAPRFARRAAVRLLLDRLRSAEREAPQRPFAEHLADLAVDDDNELSSDDVRAHRDALLELGREFVAYEGGAGGVAGFVAWMDATTRGETAGTPGVELVTFHRAKGLEWPVVFVTGLERGLVPVANATAPELQAEERRLLHVACSRATDELHCSWARARTVGTRRSVREPSPYLDVLERAVPPSGAPPVDTRARVDELRQTLAAASPPAPRERPVRRHVH